ncbi:MAG: hypothetical protein PHI23_04085 [Candidatus Peribacteraceae bacterium]|nr:hypothetical protein [Candidatus Peribacteraceae bacterium]
MTPRTDTLQEPFEPLLDGQGKTGDAQKDDLRRRRNALISYFREFIGETFYTLHVASEEETDSLRKGLLHIGLDEGEIREWETFRDTVAERQRESARTLSKELDALLARARDPARPYISQESEARWRERFQDPSLGYKAKEYFVHHQMPSYFQAWEREAQKRWVMLKDPRLKNVTTEDVKDLDKFLHGKQFLTLHFDERVDLSARVSAAILAKERHATSLHARARTLLDNAAEAGAISRTKVGRWLEHIFREKCPTPKAAEAFVENQLKKVYIPDWMKTRCAFDRVDAEMEKKGVPPGWNRLSPEKFLAMSFEQRKSYVEEAERRVHAPVTSTNEEMKNVKFSIRHDLDTEDWEGAAILLKKGRALLLAGKGSDHDRIELNSMERYLSAFRTPDKEQQHPMENARQTLEQMRAAFVHIPPSIQPLYLKAITEEDYDTAATFMRIAYNWAWCRRNKYLNGSKEEILRKRAIPETIDTVRHGHKKTGVQVAKLDSVSSLEQKSAIRNYQGEWGADVLFVSPRAQDSLLSKVRDNKNNWAFGYWVTMIPEGVAYEQMEYVVSNVHWVLKSGMRKLASAGIPFTLTDSVTPASLSGSRPKQKYSDSPYAIAT